MSVQIKSIVLLFFLLITNEEIALCQLRNEVVNGDTILIFTQPMRDKFNETVLTEVSKIDSFFKYDFEIISGSASNQNIWFWMIFSKADIDSTQSPSEWRFINRAKDPARMSWGARNKAAEIIPSSSKKGFRIYSKAFPTIQDYYMEGWEQIILQSGQEPDSVENSSFFEVAKKGVTIFPRESTIDGLTNFTDTLETFRFRSCEELEWANDTSVCAQLEDDLSEVKTALVNEDSLSAANALNRFIELVEAEKEGSLTSEGYALLYFNAQYLAERLPLSTSDE